MYNNEINCLLHIENSAAGVQQIVVNQQGQQLLVQRAAPAQSSQPQNIIVRSAGQSNIVQLQQQASGQQSAQQALQVWWFYCGIRCLYCLNVT